MAEEEDTTTEDAPTEAEAPETEPTEAVAEEQVEDAPAEATSAADPAPAAEPEEALAPKERRARARAAKAAKTAARGPRSAEERQADREARRAAKATARRAGRAKATAKHKDEAHSRVPTPPREHVAGTQKVRQGVVVSDKADKTITVRIDVARRHRKYQKIVRTSQTLHAHDESNDAHIGDTVSVREARPLSRTKRWRLVGVVERAK
jgi:small subunit ribosomal protein S17